MELAIEARDSSKKETGPICDTLAAAYAEIDNFEQAVRWEERTLEDAEFSRDHGDDARKRLELYKDKKPYRQYQRAPA